MVSRDCQIKSKFGLLDGRIATKIRKVKEELTEMVNSLADRFSLLQDGIRGVRTFDKVGIVRRVVGLVIESEGPEASIGQVCSIHSDRT